MKTKIDTKITIALNSAKTYFNLDVDVNNMNDDEVITLLDRLYRAGMRGKNSNCCSSIIQDTMARYAREAKEALAILNVEIW